MKCSWARVCPRSFCSVNWRRSLRLSYLCRASKVVETSPATTRANASDKELVSQRRTLFSVTYEMPNTPPLLVLLGAIACITSDVNMSGNVSFGHNSADASGGKHDQVVICFGASQF